MPYEENLSSAQARFTQCAPRAYRADIGLLNKLVSRSSGARVLAISITTLRQRGGTR